VSCDIVYYLSFAAERKLDLKIISTGNTEYASVEVFSDDDGSPPSRIFIAIIVSRCSFDDNNNNNNTAFI